MPTTVSLGDALPERARSLWGIEETFGVRCEALTALSERKGARPLARLGEERAGFSRVSTSADPQRIILVDTAVSVDHLRAGEPRHGRFTCEGLAERRQLTAWIKMVGQLAQDVWGKRIHEYE